MEEETKEPPADDRQRALAKQEELREKDAIEQETQRELLAAYAASVARNDNDDWAELRNEAAPPDSSVASWLFGPTKLREEDAPAEADEAQIDSARKHWTNYDIEASLRPNLVGEREYYAALTICRACRVFNQKREASRRSESVGNVAISQREATKIKRVWWGGKGRRAMRDAKQASFEAEKDWKAYEDFRATLLGTGYSLSRWSHSKKAIVPCTITISKDRDWLLMKCPSRKTKKRRLKDIHTIAKGYKSPFLRDLLHQPKEELVLTLMLRRAVTGLLGNKEIIEESLDFMFEVHASMRGKGHSEMANDGKFICKRFFSNFEKLKREVESEEAFFFNDDGVYCQVGTSIFDRWEQVTLIDPQWDQQIDDDEKRVRLHRKYEEEKHASLALKKPPQNCFLTAPIPEGKKPQDDLTYVYHSEDDKRATWHSQTIDIDYGEFKEKELRRRQQHDPSVEIVTCYRKEVFTLQACGPVDEDDPESDIVPLYGRHRKNRRLGDDEPIPAPFDDLLPFFRNKLQAVYGDIGVGGWRNTFDGTFELPDDMWRVLCGLCERGTKEQKSAGRKLMHALDGYDAQTDDEGASPKTWRAFSFSSLSPRRKDTSNSVETVSSNGEEKVSVEISDVQRKKREQAVLDVLWKKKAQKEGAMWRKSPRSFNTAQKKALEKEKKDLEKEAQQRIADERLQQEAIEAERRKLAGTLEEEAAEEVPEDVVEEAEEEEVEEAGTCAPTPSFDVVVLERSGKRAPRIALMIQVAAVPALSGVHFRGKKGHAITPKCALRVVEVDDDEAPASVSNASQNGLLRAGDYLVGVNDHYPANVDDLAKLAGNSSHRRVLRMARPRDISHATSKVIQI